MASYGVKFRLEFEDELGRGKRVDILKKDYTGGVTQINGAGFSPVFTSMQNQGDEKFETLRGTEIELNVWAQLISDVFVGFDDELFYVIDNQGVDSKWVRKCTVNATDGITTLASWQFPTSAQEPQIAFDEGMIGVLGNNNVLAYVMGANDADGDIFLFLLDEDLTLIDSLHLTALERKRVPRVFVDNDDSIYLPTGTNSTPIFVKKYDKDLNFLFDTPNAPNTGYNFAGGNVTRNFIVLQIINSAETDIVYFFDKTDGSLQTTINRSYRTPGIDFARVLNFPDGRFVIIDRENSSGFTNYYIYSADGVQQSTGTISEVINLPRTIAGVNADNTILLTEGDTVLKYDDQFNLLWDSGVIDASLKNSKLGWTTDSGRLLMMAKNTAGSAARIYEVLKDAETVNLLDTFSSIVPLFNLGFGMRSENWQLRNQETDVDFSEIITATDTDYKIEIYEEVAAS